MIVHPVVDKAALAAEVAQMPFERRVDTHAHFIPPFYRTACEESGNSQPDGMPAVPVSRLK